MKQEIINWFYNNYPNVVQNMKYCNHYHSNGTPNPFHMENDVWTHTMMVLDKVPNDINLIFTAILHDIGKVNTRVEKQSGRVSFRLHENISTYISIEILNKAKLEFDIDVIKILHIINWHGDLWKNKDVNSIDHRHLDQKYGTDLHMFRDLVQFTKADAFGRIYAEEFLEEEIKLIDLFDHLENYSPYNTMEYYERGHKKEVVCMIGISGSGKSTWIQNNIPHYKVVGVDKFFDAKKSNYDHIMYEKVIEKFHIKALAEMKEYINNVDNVDNVVIDMTNVSKEMRRKKMCQFPVTKYHKKAVVFLTSMEKLMSQNKNREGKNIPIEVINNQIMNFELPSYDEFDEIEYIV